MQVYTALTDSNIQWAVYQWVTNNDASLATYGDIQYWDTSKITNMYQVFGYHNKNNANNAEWSKTFNGDISEWNTSQVTSFDYMFYGASSFNGDLSKWNTRKVTYMNNMFQYAPAFNGHLSRWDTGRVVNMHHRSMVTYPDGTQERLQI